MIKSMLKARNEYNREGKKYSIKKSTIIPHKAVTEQLGEFYVYVVGDSSKVTHKK